MAIAPLTPRVERLELSMDDLKRMVAETTETVRQLSLAMRQSEERSEQWRHDFEERSAQWRQDFEERSEQRRLELERDRDAWRSKLEQDRDEWQRKLERDRDAWRSKLEHDRDEWQRELEHDRNEWRRDFEQRFQQAIQEARADRKSLRRELASITHSIGRLVEDLVAPSMPGIVEQVIPCDAPPQMIGVRSARKRADGHAQEYDVLAMCGNYLMITEVKSRLRKGDIEDFLRTLEQARSFMPEHADKQIIGALATFYVDRSQALEAEQHGLVVLGVIDGLMHVLNRPDFTPKTF